MGRFVNDATGVVVVVDDSKDDRFDAGWSAADEVESKKAPAKKAASSKSEK